MSDRTVTLITGASAGLGLQTAKRLAELGHHVLLGARTLQKAEAAARTVEGSVEPVELDVTREDHRETAAAAIRERHGRLDVLVNNAGVNLGEPWVGNTVLEVPIETIQRTFDANFYAVLALTRTLLPLLREGRAPRIVNLSSVMGSLTLHAERDGQMWNLKPFAYDASKTALNALTVHLAQALDPMGIRVNSAHPGWVKTALGGAYAPMSVEEGAETVVALADASEGPTGGFFHQGQPLPW